MTLDRLASLLQAEDADAAPSPAGAAELDRLIGELRRRVDGGTAPQEPRDLQQAAVQRFCQTDRIETLGMARLIAFGLGLAPAVGEPCLLADEKRFNTLLAVVDHWRDDPRRFRRCYQGLVRSYFDIDPRAVPPAAQRNWERLRDYLEARLLAIVDKRAKDTNPDWVKCAVVNKHLFIAEPCAPQAEALLRGDSDSLSTLCARLGIAQTSWYLRDLVLAQVRAATGYDDAAFLDRLGELLALLARHPALRERGLVALLERHARVAQPPRRLDLLDAALSAFGNPWLPGSDVRWGGVAAAARTLVAEWLKAERVEGFLARLSRDARRAAFWQRYLKAMRSVQIVFGRDAAQIDESLVGLRRLAGDAPLEAPGSSHALLMTIGPLLLVEYSDRSEPLYGYDEREPLPFDLAQPIAFGGAGNSLKAEPRALCLPHRDGLPGWNCWEDMYAATLKRGWGVEPGSATVTDRSPYIDLRDEPGTAVGATPDAAFGPPLDVLASSGQDAHWRTAEAESVPYSRADLAIFARAHGLQVVDPQEAGAPLLVQAPADDSGIARVLERWGFTRGEPGRWSR